jgi:uncharacterized MAPEG superfamily protein
MRLRSLDTISVFVADIAVTARRRPSWCLQPIAGNKTRCMSHVRGPAISCLIPRLTLARCESRRGRRHAASVGKQAKTQSGGRSAHAASRNGRGCYLRRSSASTGATVKGRNSQMPIWRQALWNSIGRLFFGVSDVLTF